MHEYAGVIHVHSTYSDGSGSIPEIVQAGREAGLDFLVLTDHNTMQAAEDGHAGRHDDLLLIVGEEVSARCGHVLSLGTSSRVDHRQSAQAILDSIHDQDGRSILAHPHGVYRPVLKRRDHSWKDWSAQGYTGIELWSYMFDWAAGFHYVRFPRCYRDPDARIRGPMPETLKLWDRLCQVRRVVAVGGVDAHARRYPPFPFVVFPYEKLFRTVRTHVLLETPLSGEDGADTRALLDALSDGSCYAAWDGLAPASGFRFSAVDNASFGMGAERPFDPTEFAVHLPQPARVVVMWNGHPILSRVARRIRFTATMPGVYRVEAHLSGRPWIYSNPVYLRA